MTLLLLGIGLAAGLSLAMAFAFIVVDRTGQSGWIDAIWSFAVGTAGLAAALAPLGGGEGPSARQLVVAVLVAIWALRLGLHIARRTSGGGDDPRYAQLRLDWGAELHRQLFRFLQVQAVAGLLLALVVLVASHNPAPMPRAGDWLGMLVLAAAILGEAIADRQLAKFRVESGNRGRVCDAGLWGLSRHPNYFFEWLARLAYAPIGIDFSGAYPWGWLALAGPILMYWLLVHVSGVPSLEAHMLRSRGEAFRAYQMRVNAFWPGPARQASSGQIGRSS